MRSGYFKRITVALLVVATSLSYVGCGGGGAGFLGLQDYQRDLITGVVGALAGAILDNALPDPPVEDQTTRLIPGPDGPAGEPGPAFFSVYLDRFFGAQFDDGFNVTPVRTPVATLKIGGGPVAYRVLIPALYDVATLEDLTGRSAPGAHLPVTMRMFFRRQGPCTGGCFAFRMDARRLRDGDREPQCFGGGAADCSDGSRWVAAASVCAVGDASKDTFLTIDLPLGAEGLKYPEIAVGDFLALELNGIFEDGGTYRLLGVEFFDSPTAQTRNASVFFALADLPPDCAARTGPTPPEPDCNNNGSPDALDIASGTSSDCNHNGVPDECDIARGTSHDANQNRVPDECEDCNHNGVPDSIDLANGASRDCNHNNIPDECDIARGSSKDENHNGVPDECEDCNHNGVPDSTDIANGASRDCNHNDIPDECDIASGASQDANHNGIPDECESDCNHNGVPDAVDIANGTSQDCNHNQIPDECDIASGTSQDVNHNGIPDECEADCNQNGVPDATDIANGTSRDCNHNQIPDECDIANGTSQDVNLNGIPDECEADCNQNGVPDATDIANGTSRDCNHNQIPDECDIANGTSQDVNQNGIPDECETPGITVKPINGLVTTEAGGTAQFTAVLNTQPTADVTIALTSSDLTEGAVAPVSLTFTPSNWNTPQTVTVAGADDPMVDGDIVYTIVTAPAVSTDPSYSGLNANDVSVTNIDNDSPGITVNPSGGLVTTEAGGTALFSIVLNSQPTANVTISLSTSDPTEGVVAPVTLTFTPANWNTPQTVTVTGVDDALVDGDVLYTIVTAPAASSDPSYNGLNPSDVSVTNIDNDSPGITVNPTSGLVTTEAGGTAQFTVVLNSQPAANVTIGLTSSDLTEGAIAPASLTFTPANWNTPRIVTVTGVDDALIDGSILYTIITAPAVSADPAYNGLNSSDVSVTNLDNDAAGITVNPTSGLFTTESGGTAQFTVVLTTQPAANVTVSLASSDLTEGVVAPQAVTFTPANWNTPQTVTVTGVDDALIDGNVLYTIVTAPAVSVDPAYNGLNAADVSVTNKDNDTAGITVNPTSGLITTESGGTATFTVVLNSQPAANVTVALSSSDLTEGTVAPASLTFTPANWNTPRTVTVTGVNDPLVDGNIPYTIVTAPAVSSDPAYSGLNASDVSVTNLDNDHAGITVNPISGLITTEAGGTAQFTVVLNSQPSANVTIALSSSDLTEGTVAPASLTFTPANWNTPRTVTVTGVNDTLVDGDIPYTIVTAPAVSTDPAYSGLNASDVSVINLDNESDCNHNGVPDPTDIANGTSHDCNHNHIPDECDIAGGTSHDVNHNGIPDECEPDCNHNGVPDAMDIANGTSRDCNHNHIPDECDIACGTSHDVNHNGIPDECEPDCNHNGVPDATDIANGTSRDCNHNHIPDECDIASGTSHDVNHNGIPDECEPDCNHNGVPDATDIANGTSRDCNHNNIPDECDIANGTSQDHNHNGIPDECEQFCPPPGYTRYRLHNHPCASSAPPPYGLRLDELYDATCYHDKFTFNFDDPRSSMWADVSNSVIRIFGCAYGGRDTGSSYGDANYRGIYLIEFTYDCGVGRAPGDDDRIVNAPNSANHGRIRATFGSNRQWIPLVDYRGCDNYSFRLGDEDNDQGHLGFPGISGWGGLNHGGRPHISGSDWLFAAQASNTCLDDCNGNGVPDECDIAGGTSHDNNCNGIPDECEQNCGGPH
ncbi:MAG: Calx-beta domain-containing protein [Phycisphaerae bacterium]